MVLWLLLFSVPWNIGRRGDPSPGFFFFFFLTLQDDHLHFCIIMFASALLPTFFQGQVFFSPP